jgi:hypothetical protein
MSIAHLPARTADPDTSYDAAMKAVQHSKSYRGIVLEIIREHGPLTHDEIIAQFRHRIVMNPGHPRASDQGIRSRVSELKNMGLVREHDQKSTSNYGNASRMWIAVDPSSYVVPIALLRSGKLDEFLEDVQAEAAAKAAA